MEEAELFLMRKLLPAALACRHRSHHPPSLGSSPPDQKQAWQLAHRSAQAQDPVLYLME